MELGRDIVGMDADNKYGSGFYKCLSNDLKEELPGVDGLSPSNLRYTKRFYLLYNELVENFQQVAENSDERLTQKCQVILSAPITCGAAWKPKLYCSCNLLVTFRSVA